MLPKKLHEMNEEELRREFLIMATTFFQWNANSNIPNILRNLSERVKAHGELLESFRDTVKQASDSSSKLANALNGFTRALVIVGAIGLLLQASYVVFYIWMYFHPKV
jgi:hypothetical protein